MLVVDVAPHHFFCLFFFFTGVIQDFSCWFVPGMEQWHMQISQQRKLGDQCQRRKRYMDTFFIRMKISPWIERKSVTAYALSECNKLVHTVVTVQTYFSSCSVQEKFHKQVYGVSISSSKSNFASSIIENPEMLKIQQRHVMKQQTLANTNKPPAPPPPLIPSGTPTKQDSSAMNGRCDCFTLTLSRIKLKGSTVYIITG